MIGQVNFIEISFAMSELITQDDTSRHYTNALKEMQGTVTSLLFIAVKMTGKWF
jgi:hypothetical protein